MIYGPDHFYDGDKKIKVILERKREETRRRKEARKETWGTLKRRLLKAHQAPPEDRALLQYLPNPMKKYTMPQILKVVSDTAHVSETVILGESRMEEAIEARFLFVWLAVELTGHSLARIARFCGKHHTTAMHAHRSVEAFPLDFEDLIARACIELKEMGA
jgi:hypothetical protein